MISFAKPNISPSMKVCRYRVLWRARSSNASMGCGGIAARASASCTNWTRVSSSALTVLPTGHATRCMSVEFCDTNILVYAYDVTAGAKHERARNLVERLWREEAGAISIQVLQELFVTLTRKVTQPVDVQTGGDLIADL